MSHKTELHYSCSCSFLVKQTQRNTIKLYLTMFIPVTSGKSPITQAQRLLLVVCLTFPLCEASCIMLIRGECVGQIRQVWICDERE